jgi:tetratricopeptide (TPR) repeat protein
MAASISRELIRKGVRAVVAAGWPVRDDAALCFAQTFYTQLLEHQPFGRALEEARRQTWIMFPESNTWGAYQAYGDPDFCLDPTMRAHRTDSDDAPVAAEEVLLELDRLSPKDESLSPDPLRQALVKIENGCASDWLKQGTLQEWLGQAYGEHRLFKEAIEHYRHAAESEDSSNPATLRAIEQWINLLVRLGEEERNKAKIEEAIEKGRHLLGIAKTSERLNIMGNAHKKLAQLETNTEKVKDHLKQSAAYYRDAANPERHEGVADPYPIINVLVIEALLGNEGFKSESLLSKCESLAQQRFRETRSVWDSVTIPDVALIRAFLRHSLPQERDNLIGKYRDAFAESSATLQDQDSALKQMKFVRDILKKFSYSGQEQKTIASTIESLDYIQNKLERRDQTTESLDGKAKQIKTRPLSPKVSAKQPARKNPVREKKTRRPKSRGKR